MRIARYIQNTRIQSIARLPSCLTSCRCFHINSLHHSPSPSTLHEAVKTANTSAARKAAVAAATAAVSASTSSTPSSLPIDPLQSKLNIDTMAQAEVDAAPSPSNNGKATVVSDPFLAHEAKKNEFEIKDAELIFRNVWSNLLATYGEENLSFPKEIMWLAGAPGAGKGAMTPIIEKYRGVTAPPIEVGALLTSPEALQIKSQGKLVGDTQVVELLFNRLLQPQYQSGVIVDGFPRTKEQAECIKLLYDQMLQLREKYRPYVHIINTPLYGKFRRPIFHITVLFIDKEESVKRQLRRGQLALIHNQMVKTTGVGELKQVRETDLDPQLAEERYRQFKDQVYASLNSVKEKFHFHFINADGTPQEVQERIIKEIQYQSSMELSNETFECVRRLPLASEVIANARYELVKRLDHYRARDGPLFEKVIQVLSTEFVHIIKRQALSGRAIIRTENPVFQEHNAIDMALDCLCERGYTVVLDLTRKTRADRVNMKTGEIQSITTRLYEFQIEFPKPTIRRG